jgi:hypothetical protein
MTKTTIKSLGVAALGAALAATAAGTASATVTDNVQGTAGDVVRTLPSLENTTEALPGESGEVVDAGMDLLSGEQQVKPLADETLSHTTSALGATPAGGLTEPVTGLLGGLPVGGDQLSQLGLPDTQELLQGIQLG